MDEDEISITVNGTRYKLFDEVRISSVARSQDWILTEFNNQNDTSSFYRGRDDVRDRCNRRGNARCAGS